MSIPTGSGKSLSYRLLPKVFDILRGSSLVKAQSVAIVVSLLVALAKDQVEADDQEKHEGRLSWQQY